MAKEYSFIEYTTETAEAIRKARDLPPRGNGIPPWPEHPRQTLLPPMMTDADGGGTSQHPFDVLIVNNGTEESPQYAVKVYDSTASESQYAGIVYLGTSTYSVQTAELNINTTEYFYVDLLIVYNSSTGYSFSYEIRTSSTVNDNNTTARYTIAYGKTTGLSSHITTDIHVNDRWV